MSAFTLAFKQFFAALAVLFTAFEKVAGTVDNLATVGYESSGQYRDQARIERQAALRKLQQDFDHQVDIDAAKHPALPL